MGMSKLLVLMRIPGTHPTRPEDTNLFHVETTPLTSHHGTLCIANFPNLWYPPTRGTRLAESRFLARDTSMYRTRLQSLRSGPVRGFCDCELILVWHRWIQLGSFVHVLQGYSCVVPRQGGSTHPWVGYVSGDFEERCFLAMLVAVLNWDDLPFANGSHPPRPISTFRRYLLDFDLTEAC